VEQTKKLERRTILLVDDNIDTRVLTKMFLNNFGYEVDSVDSGIAALKQFNPVVHNLVLTDNSMPEMSGGEMAHLIKQRSPKTPVLMCTGHPPNDCSAIDLVIAKPTHLLAIKDAISQLLESR
jgi:CheY-like chemotaxis protein